MKLSKVSKVVIGFGIVTGLSFFSATQANAYNISTQSSNQTVFSENERYNGYITRVDDLIKELREHKGLTHLTYNQELAEQAETYITQFTSETFAINPNPQNPNLSEEINYEHVGQNVGNGDDWAIDLGLTMYEEHRNNITNPNFTQYGVGFTQVEDIYGNTIYLGQIIFTGGQETIIAPPVEEEPTIPAPESPEYPIQPSQPGESTPTPKPNINPSEPTTAPNIKTATPFTTTIVKINEIKKAVKHQQVQQTQLTKQTVIKAETINPKQVITNKQPIQSESKITAKITKKNNKQ